MNRTRRLRKNPSIRSMVRETKLSVDDFIYPLFIVEGENIKKEIGILMGYLPQQLTEEELNQIVSDTVFEVGAVNMQDLGKVMSALMPKIKGRADGKLVNSIVRQHLQR